MNRREAEEYLYCAMSIGEQLLVSGAEVGRVEDTIRRICLAYGRRGQMYFPLPPVLLPPYMELISGSAPRLAGSPVWLMIWTG